MSGPGLAVHAGWVLAAAFGLSAAYELYRATLKAGTSRHDSMRAFLTQGTVLYGIAGGVIASLLSGTRTSPQLGLLFCIGMILVSIFYYNPRVMPERRPGLVDWFEDLVFTGLLFVAAAQLVYALAGGVQTP